MKFFLKIAGYIIVTWNRLWGTTSRKTQILKNDSSDRLDHTGHLLKQATIIKDLSSDNEIVFPDYEGNIAHSIWRAQELSLFKKNKCHLLPPVLDFGCGDGSFSSIIFDSIDFGVDPDKNAIFVAEQYKIYGSLICSQDNHINLPDESVQSVFSNSVLEHVEYLEQSLIEISRILVPDGVFIFTAPTTIFTDHMTYLFGKREANRINDEFYHRHLLSIEDWTDLLAKNHFKITEIIYYQPIFITFLYRLLDSKFIGRICKFVIIKFWFITRRLLIKLIRHSIHIHSNGSNVMLIMKKMRT